MDQNECLDLEEILMKPNWMAQQYRPEASAFDFTCLSSVESARSKGQVKTKVKAKVEGLSFFYGKQQALNNINLSIVDSSITALIGASGCGKSTLLRCFNRMHDLYSDCHYQGSIWLYPDNMNLVDPTTDPLQVRLSIGMVFQKPNPFPKSIYENVAAGLRIRGVKHKTDLDGQIEKSLKAAALWEEVKDRLHKSALSLSGGQQQRLCIARALAVEPSVLLLDEPTSALDPIATARIEELLLSLSGATTVLVVTHNMQQARRISDVTAFMHLGELVESQETDTLFNAPQSQKTADYLQGRFG
jgi:phosphate transport system ATP-binding protein